MLINICGLFLNTNKKAIGWISNRLSDDLLFKV